MNSDLHDKVTSARSWLFTPGTEAERFAKGTDSGSDAVISDLEDSVAADRKTIARRNVLDYLAAPHHDTIQAVRINSPGIVAGLRDVLEFVDSDADPDVVVLPKAEAAGGIAQLRQILAEAGKRALVMPIIESARGLFALRSILSDPERVAVLMVGAADLARAAGPANTTHEGMHDA